MHHVEFPSALLGPGSQAAEPDGAELAYLSMPDQMLTYSTPQLPERETAHQCAAGLAALEQLLEGLRAYKVGHEVPTLDLLPLPDADRALVMQALGEGEVSILFTSGSRLRMQETRLAGVWRVQSVGSAGELELDEVQVADVPIQVREMAFADAVAGVELELELPPGILTAQSVLAEINDRVPAWKGGDAAHVINLTLLPLSNEDLTYLERRLGQGPLAMLSRGYGSCRIATTAVQNCWWVQHFNADGRLIVNTIELVDVPSAALAAQEDLEDSGVRLVDILDALR